MQNIKVIIKVKTRGTKKAQARVRVLIVAFLKGKIGTQQKASELYGITLNAVQKFWRAYKLEGSRGIAPKKNVVYVVVRKSMVNNHLK